MLYEVITVLTLIMILEQLKGINHRDDVYIIATVQEEVGLRGAEMVAYSTKPDLAIVIVITSYSIHYTKLYERHKNIWKQGING